MTMETNIIGDLPSTAAPRHHRASPRPQFSSHWPTPFFRKMEFAKIWRITLPFP